MSISIGDTVSIKNQKGTNKYYVHGQGGDRDGNGSKDIIYTDSTAGTHMTNGVTPASPMWINPAITIDERDKPYWFIISDDPGHDGGGHIIGMKRKIYSGSYRWSRKLVG